MAQQATIYDVATRAGVSISTVSHTLNRPQRVNATTRQRVLAAIDELGYVPRATAIAHARKVIGRIGVLAPFTSYPSHLRRLSGVLKEAGGDATEVVVYDQTSAASAMSPLLSSLPVTHRLDGVLIMGLPLDDALVDRLLRQKLSTVLIDSTRPEFDSITIDDDAAGELVGRHLIARGCHTVAYATEGQRSMIYQSQDRRRLAGLQRALTKAGLGDSRVRIIETTSSMNGGSEALSAILASGDVPDAVFANEDLIAAGVLLECERQGIRVPDDLAIVGFDDGELAEALGITTVRQPLEDSGQLGFNHLRDAIRGALFGPRHVTLGVQLVVRATT